MTLRDSAGSPAVKVDPSSPAGKILTSSIFDVEFYAGQASQTFASPVVAVEHYLEEGWRRGLDPHPLFSTQYYVENYPDVARTNVNPLLHFISHGGFEGRNPSALFESEHYLNEYKDVAKSKINPLVHYIQHGGSEGRNPSSWFDSRFYKATYADVVESGANPLVHYALIGKRQGRRVNSRQLIAPEVYLPMREIEPLLPSFDSLTVLRQVKESAASPAGKAYRKLQALLTEPFSHLLLLPAPTNTQSVSAAERFIERIAKELGEKAALVVHTEGGASGAGATAAAGARRVIFLDDLSNQLSESDKVAILCRLVLQAQPRIVHTIDSVVGWHLFRKYSRQLLLGSKLAVSLLAYEIDKENVPTGFSLLLSPCLESLDAVFVQEQSIRNAIAAQTGLPPRLAERLMVCDSEKAFSERLIESGYLDKKV